MSDASKSKRPPAPCTVVRSRTHPSSSTRNQSSKQRPLADADRARRAVVVVVARVLAVDPADEPDVEIRDRGRAAGRSASRRRGGRTSARDAPSPRARRRARTSRHDRDPCPPEPAHAARSRGRSRQEARGVSDWRTCVTASPNPRTASSVGRESTTGVSLPYTSCPTPNVSMQSSIARRPCVDTSKKVFGSSAERTSTPRRAQPLELERAASAEHREEDPQRRPPLAPEREPSDVRLLHPRRVADNPFPPVGP